MKILNSIQFENEEDKNNFTKELKVIEQKEAITLNYSFKLEKSLKNLFMKIEKADIQQLIKYRVEYLVILNRLSIIHFCNIIHWLDINRSGVLVSFIMEANVNKKAITEKNELLSNKYNNKQQVSKDEELIFYQRIYQLQYKKLLNYIFSSVKVRLIEQILEEDEDDFVYSMDFKESLINNEFSQWIKEKATYDEIAILEKCKNRYVIEKKNNIKNKGYNSQYITYVPKLLEEAELLRIINKLVDSINNQNNK